MPRLGFTVKLFVAFVITLLIILALLLTMFQVEQREWQRGVLAEHALTATSVAVQVDHLFDAATTLGWSVAADPRAQTLDPRILDPFLTALVRQQTLVAAVNVFDAHGVNRGWGTPGGAAEPRLTVSARSGFRLALAQNSPVVTPVLNMRRMGMIGIVVDVPIRNQAGQLIGIVSVVLRADQLASRYRQMRLPPDERIVVLDPSGRLAFDTAHPGLTYKQGAAFANVPAVRRVLAGAKEEQAQFTGPISHQEWLGAFVQTPRYHWVVGVTTPRARALATPEAWQKEALIGWGGITVASLFLALMLAGSFRRPMRKLTIAAGDLGAGDLSRRVSIQTGDELQDLGSALNQMAARLQQREADVSRLRSEAENRAAKLRAVLDSVIDPVWIGAPDRTLVDANASARRELGGTADQFFGHSIEAALNAVGIAGLDGKPLQFDALPIARTLRGETFTNAELRLRAPNGHERIFVTGGAPIRDDRGQVTLGVVFTHDVTSQRRAEEALRRAEERLRLVVTNAPIVLFALDHTGRFTLSEGRGLAVLGLKPGQVVGQSVFDVYHEQPALLANVRRALEGHDFTSTDVLRPSGLVWEIHWSPFRDDAGKLLGVVGVATDVTARVHAEQEREQLLARTTALAEIGRALVTERSLRGVAEVVIEQSVKAMGVDAIGLWLADPTHRRLSLCASRHFAPEAMPAMQDVSYDAPLIMATAARTEQRQVVEDTATTDLPEPSRKLAHVARIGSIVALPMRSRGRLVGVLAFTTHQPRHYSQSELDFDSTVADLFAVGIDDAQLFHDVQQALRLREEFMGAVAHELRTPIAVIRGWAQFLLRPKGRTLEREQTALTAMIRQADRITRFIDDLFAVARLRRESTTLQPERISLSAFVRGVVTDISLAHPTRDIRVTTTDDACVDADPRLIREVLRHLIENAVRYSPADRPVDVAMRRVGTEAVVSVTDRGIGIATERQAHVFEPLFEPVPAGFPGYTGDVSLGLYLSKQAIQASGGQIWLASAPNKGSTFSFSLPLVAMPKSSVR